MIFKFDKSGNMENLEGDIQDMARKKDKERFNQMDIGLVNAVKEEVLNGMTIDNHAEEDQEMIQQMENLTREETAVGYESIDKWEEQGRSGEVINLDENVVERPPFGSLSSLSENTKEDKDSEQMSKEEFNETRNELDIKREEAQKKKELRKLKKEIKENDLKLKESTNWSFSPVIPVYNQGEITKYKIGRASCRERV